MPIISVERVVVKKEGNVVEKTYYRKEKKVSLKEFWKFWKAARREDGTNLYEIYGGQNDDG